MNGACPAGLQGSDGGDVDVYGGALHQVVSFVSWCLRWIGDAAGFASGAR